MNQNNTSNKSQSYIYHSKNLKLSFRLNNKFDINEDITFIDLLEKNGKGKISISRIGTNFSNINNYLNDFDMKRAINVKEESKLQIDGYKSIKRIENFIGGPIIQQKIYYILVNNWVYSFSAGSTDLYSDLDQVAQSFRYSP